MNKIYKINVRGKKVICSVLILCAGCFTSLNAQFSSPFSVGLGFGGTNLHGDFKNEPVGYAASANFDFHLSPFFSAGINLQAGNLKGEANFGSFKNDFMAGNFNIKVRAGQFYAAKKNYGLYSLKKQGLAGYLAYAYAGVGIGLIRSDVNAKINEGNTRQLFDESYGTYDKTATVIPLNVGIDIPFKQSMTGPTWSVNINYQLNVSTGDRLDGFAPMYSEHKDFYSYWSLGIQKALFVKK